MCFTKRKIQQKRHTKKYKIYPQDTIKKMKPQEVGKLLKKDH